MKKSALLALGAALILIAVGALWAWQRFSVQYEESFGPVRVSPVKTRIQGDPDDFVTVVFVLYNLSDQERSYEFSVEVPQGWTLLEGLSGITVGSQAHQELFLTVQIPPATPPGSYLLSLRAQSDSSFAVGRTQIAVRARERLKLALASSDLIVRPNEEKTATLTVTNRGNVSVRVALTVTVAPVGWQFRLGESSVALAPGESKAVNLIVKPLSDAELAPGRFTVQATSASSRDELSFTVVLLP